MLRAERPTAVGVYLRDTFNNTCNKVSYEELAQMMNKGIPIINMDIDKMTGEPCFIDSYRNGYSDRAFIKKRLASGSFKECRLSYGSYTNGDDGDITLYYKIVKNWLEIYIPDGVINGEAAGTYYMPSLSSFMSKSAQGITKVRLTGGKHLEYLSLFFSRCKTLEAVDLRKLNTYSLTNIDLMFHGCTNLKKVHFGNLQMPYCTKVFKVFSGCKSLQSFECDSPRMNMALNFDYQVWKYNEENYSDYDDSWSTPDGYPYRGTKVR